MSEENCVTCDVELCIADRDPDGTKNAECLRCIAEQNHDFDREPNAVFSRMGERLDPPQEPKPCSRVKQEKPAKIYVLVDQLKEWEKVLSNAGAARAVNEIRAMITASEERKKQRKKK
ncbi:hypothetical protein [Pseudomonas putida]|uniref:Uncharacterized protein n=1 Tax=Pseudomonas putida TaxID=303 RepID=A0A8I1ED79_PSEPU|nr:hypothetical protein [Pseudomonas putida]MBI6883123.1 hypothetical protein [Pseudomonas putida]